MEARSGTQSRVFGQIYSGLRLEHVFNHQEQPAFLHVSLLDLRPRWASHVKVGIGHQALA